MTLSPALRKAVLESKNKYGRPDIEMIDPEPLPKLDSDLAAGLAEIGLRRATKRELQSLIVKAVKAEVNFTADCREAIYSES